MWIKAWQISSLCVTEHKKRHFVQKTLKTHRWTISRDHRGNLSRWATGSEADKALNVFILSSKLRSPQFFLHLLKQHRRTKCGLICKSKVLNSRLTMPAICVQRLKHQFVFCRSGVMNNRVCHHVICTVSWKRLFVISEFLVTEFLK